MLLNNLLIQNSVLTFASERAFFESPKCVTYTQIGSKKDVARMTTHIVIVVVTNL